MCIEIPGFTAEDKVFGVGGTAQDVFTQLRVFPGNKNNQPNTAQQLRTNIRAGKIRLMRFA